MDEKSEPVSPETLSSTLSKDSKAVRELKSKLNNLDSSRDSAVRELRDIGSRLRSISAKINELKAGRDKETAAVKELKVKRQQANDALKAVSAELKLATEARDAARAASKGKVMPRSTSHLASEIESMEMKMQTEVMSFDKEKEMMKVIKGKKKIIDSAKAMNEALSAYREVFGRFSELRKQSNVFHNDLQKHAAASQEMHEEMMKLIPQLKELRQRRKEIFDKFGKLEEDYTVTGSTLQETLHELTEVKGKLDTITAEKQKKSIEEKENKLTDMLKSGKKLTARDLLILKEDK